MDIRNYQELAMRTSPEGHDRVLNGCMGLIGETGEIVDVVKKWKFQSGDHAELPKDKLIDECGDVLWYCAELATGLDASLSDLFIAESAYFNKMRELNETAPLEITVMRLSAIVIEPAMFLFDGLPEHDQHDFGRDWQEVQTKAELVGIMSTIRDILEIHCGIKLEDAMEHNIEKLRRRYPDGFDPERSLHRSE